MKRAVFFNTQPSTYEDEKAFAAVVTPGNALHRIIDMMGVGEQAFFNHFHYLNTSPYHEPDGFSPEYCQVSIRNFRPLLHGRRTVLLGPQVAAAFDIERSQYDWCQWIDHPKWEGFHGLFCVIPYPSAQNRLYDNPSMRSMVVQTLNALWYMSQEEKMR